MPHQDNGSVIRLSLPEIQKASVQVRLLQLFVDKRKELFEEPVIAAVTLQLDSRGVFFGEGIGSSVVLYHEGQDLRILSGSAALCFCLFYPFCRFSSAFH